MTEVIKQYAKTFSDPPERERVAGRGLIIKNGKVLLSYEKNTDVYMTPGGGLENGESLEECCIRELREETGYIVTPIKPFLIINEYCFETVYITNYFICKTEGKAEQTLTDIEIEHGITPVWLDFEEALNIFGSYASKREDIASLYLREFTVLSKLRDCGGLK